MADKTVKIAIQTVADTTGAKKTQQSFADLEAEVLRLSSEVKRLAEALDNANRKPLNDLPKKLDESGKKMGKMGMLANQASYQLGDFFTQVEMGTGMVRAFSQQAPQMLGALSSAGVLSAKMAMTFAGVGAVIPLLAMALPKIAGMFSDVKAEADGAGEAVKKMGENAAKIEVKRLEDARTAMEFTRAAARELTDEFPLTEKASRQAAISVAKDAGIVADSQKIINKLMDRQVDAYKEIEASSLRAAAVRRKALEDDLAEQKKASQAAFNAQKKAQDDLDVMLEMRERKQKLYNQKREILQQDQARLVSAKITLNDPATYAGGGSWSPNSPDSMAKARAAEKTLGDKELNSRVADNLGIVGTLGASLAKEGEAGGALDVARLNLEKASKNASDLQLSIEKSTEQIENTAKKSDTAAKLQTVADQGEQIANETLAILGKITPANEAGKRQIETIHGIVDDLNISQKEGPRLFSELSKLIGQMQLDGNMSDLIKEVVQIQKHQTDNQKAVNEIAKKNAEIEANQKAIDQKIKSLNIR